MDHTISLIKRAQQGEKQAIAQLVEEHTGLVWCVAKRFFGRGTEAEDLFQIGTMGLLKAIERFDFQYQVKFSTYALPMIQGEIQRHLRDNGMVKVSRSLKELSVKMFRAREVLIAMNGQEPTIDELAVHLQVEKEELIEAMESSYEVESLYQPIQQGEGQELRLLDKLVQEENQEEQILNHLLLKQLLETLDKEERQLIYLRYFQNQTQSVIGKKMGMSQVQVSRMEKRILKNLHKMSSEQPY